MIYLTAQEFAEIAVGFMWVFSVLAAVAMVLYPLRVLSRRPEPTGLADAGNRATGPFVFLMFSSTIAMGFSLIASGFQLIWPIAVIVTLGWLLSLITGLRSLMTHEKTRTEAESGRTEQRRRRGPGKMLKDYLFGNMKIGPDDATPGS